jgi:amino acid adenylation domain-containing protein
MNEVPEQNEMGLSPESTQDRSSSTPKNSLEIQAWLVQQISETLFLDPKEVDITVDFNSYGLSSRDAIVLSGDLEEWLERRLSPTLLYEYPSIELLSKHLAQNLPEQRLPGKVEESEVIDQNRNQLPFYQGGSNGFLNEPIAVIGLDCRFPGADNPEAFWSLLANGVDAITDVPHNRWKLDEYYDASPGKKGKMISHSGGFLENIDFFDAQFFGISPREAMLMDPQQRLLLQTTWRAFEDSGIIPATIAGTACGVYIGISTNDYANYSKGDVSLLDVYTGTGNAMCIAANRISYFFDLRGPSIALDTACSSSLVAIHMATESLRKGESNMAIAGGVNLILSPELNVVFSQAGMLSPDGRCKTFDASANGYVRGEGCAVVVLKRLKDALSDGDYIHAIIRGSAVNQDGKSNGLTAPNGLAQQDVIRQAIHDAGIKPEDIDYIEAHGTGTSLGDPIEMNAIAAVMQGRSRDNPCIVGSVKTNFGHLESAAGIAGLIKTILSLENELIPTHLHFKNVNPFIHLDEMPIKIPASSIPWQHDQKMRLAGVSSFGFGGTNAHVIVSESPVVQKLSRDDIGQKVFCVSAKDRKTLFENVRNLYTFIEKNDEPNIQEICAALSVKRTHFDHRIAWFIDDRKSALEKLGEYLQRSDEGVIESAIPHTSAGRKIAFLFTGQGSQYQKMGFDLYINNPTFKQFLDQCQIIADKYLRVPLLSVIFKEENLVNETEFTQPALFALEYSLARLLISWGISPDYVMGHSLGEYVAATISGVMSLEDGLRLVIERARLMQALPPVGEMAAIFAPRDVVLTNLAPFSDDVTVAAFNGPNHTVISGKKERVRDLVAIFESKGLTVRFLNVSHAFHSPLMEPMLESYNSFTRFITFHPANIPIVSNLTGQLFENGIMPNSDYWCQHIRQPVRFQENILELIKLDCDTFIEIGPHPTLNGMGKRCLPANIKNIPDSIEWIPSLQKDRVDSDVLYEMLARLYTLGFELKWAEIGSNSENIRRIPSLPGYAFQGERFWQNTELLGRIGQKVLSNAPNAPVNPFIGERIQTPFPFHIYQSQIPNNLARELFSLKASCTPILSNAAMVVFALMPANELFGEGKYRLFNFEFPTLSFPEACETLFIQTLISKEPKDHAYSVEVYRKYMLSDAEKAEWFVCGKGMICIDDQTSLETIHDIDAKVNLVDHEFENSGNPTLSACSLIDRSFFILKELNSTAGLEYQYSIISKIESLRFFSSSVPVFWQGEVQSKSTDFPGPQTVKEYRIFDEGRNLLVIAEGIRFDPIRDEDLQRLDAFKHGDQYNTWLLGEEHTGSETTGLDDGEINLEVILATVAERRSQLITKYLTRQISLVLRMDSQKIPLDKPINYMGLDSIMAIELKNGIEKTLKINLPVATLLQGPDINRLVEIIQLEITNQDQLKVINSKDDQVIRKAKRQTNEFQLTVGQRAMWLQHQVDPGSVFNPVQAVRIRSNIEPEKIRSAFQSLIERHPALRTTFSTKDGEPIQVIHPHGDVDFTFEDFSGWDQAEIQQRLGEQGNQIFDLVKGPLLRVFLYQCGPNDFILMISAHHLVVDLWSLAILINDLNLLLSSADREAAITPMDYDLIDFVDWQTKMLAGEEGVKLWDYWQNQLKGSLPVLDLPTDYARPAVQSHNGAVKTIIFDDILSNNLQALGGKYGCTLFMVLLAAFKTLLFRYSGQEDFVIGTPTTGRSRQEFTDVIGYFVNSVPIKSHLSADKRFIDYLSEIRDVVVGALNHQDFPMAMLVERLHPDRDPSVLPLFQVMFAFQRAHLLYDEGLSQFAVGMDGFQMNLAGLPLESVVVDQKYTPFDLTMTMARTNQGLGASLSYNTDLFLPQTIERFLQHFEVMLNGIVENPEQEITKLPILTKSEYHQLVVEWNNTQDGNPLEQCIFTRFEEIVKQSPESIAITFEGIDVTYEELNNKSNQLAHYLRRLGVGKDKIVGVFMERSPEMIISILGIMKAGGAYLPLDPVHPYERVAFMLQDAHVRLLMTQSSLMSRLPTLIAQPVFIDAHWGMIVQESIENPGYEIDINDLAYIIYTSGSTGKSKGVMIQHRGLANLVNCHITGFQVDKTSAVLQFASCGFDASVMEIFMALGSGGKLVLARREVLLSVPDLLNLIAKEEITTFILPPSLLAMLPDDNLPKLRTPISGGESCSREVAERWSRGRTFINAYGPTETTIAPTYYRTNDLAGLKNNVPIGKPIANNQIFIVDKNMQPVPIGLPGEIHVGGIGLARGYLNRPELTEEKFINNPFYKILLEAGQKWSSQKLYKTGDLAKYLPDGNIEYLGRIDFQVKVRGFRIELGEIESIIDQYPPVRHVVVIVREDEPGNKKIVAYIVPEIDQTVRIDELRRYLREKLPEYMIPAAFILMDILPLNPNGKVDRQALPSPSADRFESEVTFVSPVTDIERTIASIWQDVLSVNRVGLHDNFFDLGGHSLLMAKAHMKLQEALGREFSLIHLFRYPTVNSLAEYLTDGSEEVQSLKETSERADRQKEVMKKNIDKMRAIAKNRPNFKPTETNNE